MPTYNNRLRDVSREKGKLRNPQVVDPRSIGRNHSKTAFLIVNVTNVCSNKYAGKNTRPFNQHDDVVSNPVLIEETTDEGIFTFYRYKTVSGGLAWDASCDEGPGWDDWDEP